MVCGDGWYSSKGWRNVLNQPWNPEWICRKAGTCPFIGERLRGWEHYLHITTDTSKLFSLQAMPFSEATIYGFIIEGWEMRPNRRCSNIHHANFLLLPNRWRFCQRNIAQSSQNLRPLDPRGIIPPQWHNCGNTSILKLGSIPHISGPTMLSWSSTSITSSVLVYKSPALHPSVRSERTVSSK